MKQSKRLFGVAMVAGAALFTMSAAAEARCADCNKPISSTKVNTSYKYKTVQKVQNVTQYKDVDSTKYQKNIHRVVTVTRVQPVRRVNVVTRVHNRTVILSETQNVAQAATLPTRTITTAKTIHVNHAPTYRSCNCN